MRKLFLLTFVIIASIATCIACSGAQQPPPDTKTTTDLRTTVTDFHLKMRWGLWDQAVSYTSPEYRPRFEARYDELGDDFKISNLEIKKVTSVDLTTALVDVEQESYKEPEMTVKTIRYIEDWQMTDNVWRLHDRLTKDEWEKRQKEQQEKAEEAIEQADEQAEQPADEASP